MTAMQELTNPEERQRNLDRMKRRATGLLVFMGVLFIVTKRYDGSREDE